jgi:hypothetical protein
MLRICFCCCINKTNVEIPVVLSEELNIQMSLECTLNIFRRGLVQRYARNGYFTI